MLQTLHKLMEKPLVFNLVTRLFGLGGRSRIMGEYVRGLAEREAQGRVLEIGSGTGQFQGHLLARAGFYIASDLNQEYLVHARARHGQMACLRCDGSRLPLKNDSLDAIFALFVLHHLDDNQVRNCLAEAHRCLRPGGRLVIADPFADQKPWDLVGMILARIDRGRFIRPRQHWHALLAGSPFGPWQSEPIPRSWPYDMSTYLLGKETPEKRD